MLGWLYSLVGKRDYSQKPAWLEFRSSKNFIAVVVSCMSFTDIFLYGIIVPVAPRALRERAGIPEEEIQSWVSLLLTTYGAALLVSSPIFGYLADRSSSRQLPLLIGLLILGGATAMLCVGTSIELWVFGRALQGSSAAMVWTVGLALLADSLEENEMGKYMGVISLAMTGGTLLGPLAGGVVYDHGGFYAVFGLSFALIGLDIILRFIMIEKKVANKYYEASSEEREGILDSQQGAKKYGTLAPKQNSEDAMTNRGARDNDQKLTKSTNIPPVIWLLSSKRLLVALWATMVWSIMLSGFDATLPLFVKETFNWSSSGSGLIFLAVFFASLFGPWFGAATDRYGTRLLAAGGFLFATPFYVLLRFVTHESLAQEVLLCALLVFIGVGLAMVNTPLFTEVTHIVRLKERQNPEVFGPGGAIAQAYGLFNLAFAAGTIVGPIVAGHIREQAGWATMGWSIAIITGFTSIPVFLVTGGWIGRSHPWKIYKSDEEQSEPGGQEVYR